MNTATTKKTSNTSDFKEFMRRREEAASAYVTGDAGPVDRIISKQFPATFFGPMGGHTEGTDEVATRYKDDADSFAPGGESNFEILQMASGDDIAYWVGFQKAKAKMRGKVEPVSFDLRITEIFRREGADWKLIHRHADPLAEAKTNSGAKSASDQNQKQ